MSCDKYTLRAMRDLSNLTIKDIVSKTNISYKSIRNWETGQNVPSLINIYELLEVYGFTLDQLDLSTFYNKNKK